MLDLASPRTSANYFANNVPNPRPQKSFRLLTLVLSSCFKNYHIMWPPPPPHTHTASKIMGLYGLQNAHQWKCSNSAKIWARNLWYHTRCVSGRLYHKTKRSCLTLSSCPYIRINTLKLCLAGANSTHS